MVFVVFSEVRKAYANMLRDISRAKKKIFLETYIYDNDETGRSFREVLVKKAKEGVRVRVLVDAWGSTARKDFFKDLVDAGGEVRFFKELKYVIRIFSKNHERNHRKLLLIDNKISYLGSANITSSCLDWRELVLRLEGEIASHFELSFQHAWNASDKLGYKKMKNIVHRGFEIIHDTPADNFRVTEKRYVSLIRSARKRIMIETPYFVPPHSVRVALKKAVKRGVIVDIVLPKISDVGGIDILRNRYLGKLYRVGIKLHYYFKKNLHSKLLIIDDRFFLLGSSNLDYRSFIHQHEINLLGRDMKIIGSLTRYFNKGLAECEKFNYVAWKERSSFKRILEIFGGFVDNYF